MKLEGKVIFIAGASGMAAATARLAVAEGAKVFAVDRDERGIAALKASLPANLHTVRVELTEEVAVDAALTECLRIYGKIDAVFNAVGLSGRRYGDGPLHECTLAGWDVTLNNNTTTCFLMCRAAIRYFLKREPQMPANLRGTILNMASVLAYSPQPDFFASHAYAASKGAVISMTQAAAAYYARHKININVIAPAVVVTPMSARAQKDPAILQFLAKKQPLPEGMLDAEDVARAAVFLLSSDARYMTGQVVAVDGGWTVTG